MIKANNTLNCMGDMLLSFELDALSLEDLKAIQDFMSNHKNKHSYAYLNNLIATRAQKGA